MVKNIHINGSPVIRIVRKAFNSLRLEKNSPQKIHIIKKTNSSLSDNLKSSPTGNKLPKESISRILNFENKKLPYIRQTTPANCGPLSVINGLCALEACNEHFHYPENFPKTPAILRKMLGDTPHLRQTWNGQYGEEVAQDNCALDGSIIHKVIEQLPTIKIVGSRFCSPGEASWFLNKEQEEIINVSDWILLNENFHYVSFVRLNRNHWIGVDSIINPYLLSDETLKERVKDRYFMGMKVN